MHKIYKTKMMYIHVYLLIMKIMSLLLLFLTLIHVSAVQAKGLK